MKEFLIAVLCLFQASAFAQFEVQDTWALIVGISDYESDAVEDLSYAHIDAQRFRDYLMSPAGGRLDTTNIKMMINEKARSGSIIYEGIQWLFSNVKKNDRAIIYFSGHGSAESRSVRELGYLLAYDWQDDNDFGLIGTIPSDMLQRWLESLSIRNGADVMLIVDACRSAKFNQVDDLTSVLNQDWGKITKLVSSERGANSFEDDRWGGGSGVFTYYLLQGLYGMADDESFGNGNGHVELFELEQYLKMNIAKDTEFKQIPAISTDNLQKRISIVYAPILEELRKQKKKVDLDGLFDGNKGVEGEIEDDLSRRFHALLKEGTIMGEDGALGVFRKYQHSPDSDTRRLENMRNSLLASMHIHIMENLNAYLSGEEGLINNPWKYEAAAMLDSALAILPEESVLYNDLMANKYFLEGAIAFENGNSNKAVRSLILSLELDSFKAYTHNFLGMSYYDLREYKLAEVHLKRATNLSSNWHFPYTNLGNLHQEQGELNKAIKRYEQAIRLQPDDPYPYNNLANVYLEMGQPTMAIKKYAKALELDEDYLSALVGMGNAHYMAGNFHTAVTYFKKAIDADPQAAFIYANLANAYGQQNMLKESEKYFLKGLEVAPDNMNLYHGLAAIYQKLKRTDDFLAVLHKMASLVTNDLQINYFIGKTYAEKGDPASAVVFLKKTMQINPDFHPAYDVLAGVYRKLGDQENYQRYSSLARQHQSAAQEAQDASLYFRSRNENLIDFNPYVN